MKVVLIGRYGEGEILTGPEKVARNLFDQITKLNPDTEFITYFFKLTKKRKLKQLFFGSENVLHNQNIHRLGILKLIFTFLRKRPDIVHAVTFDKFEIVILFLKVILRFKLVYTIHGLYRYERQVFYRKPSALSDLKDMLLEKLLFVKSDSLVFLSAQMINLAQDYYNINKNRVFIFPNGVSLTKNVEGKSFNISNGIELVFYNGLDDSRKRGLEELINIFVKAKLNFVNLSVLGKPTAANYDWINFINPIPESSFSKFFGNKHLFIDNLNYMPFSIIVLEAMSLGVIPIVSSQSGISSFIKNCENGFAFDSEQPETIIEILLDIAEGKYPLDLISQNAISTAKDLSWDKIAKKYLANYQEILY
jgi:glycosyltransferase involved in cell wall biosynthesis